MGLLVLVFLQAELDNHIPLVVFIPVISQDLKISSTSITTAYMIATLFAAFLLPKMGRLVDKHGPRKILIYTVILLGFGCMILELPQTF